MTNDYINMNHQVYAPNIHLFAYHLQSEKNPCLLYAKVDEILAKLNIPNFNLSQRIDLQKEPDRLRVDLLKDEEIAKNDNISPPFQGNFTLEEKTLNFDGFAYPLRIQDSYALTLNIRIPEKDEKDNDTEYVGTALLSQFNPDYSLLPNFIASSLGQTLLITAWVAEDKRDLFPDYLELVFEESSGKDSYLTDLAQECLEAFIPDREKQPSFHREGQLFGSPIYEYGILGDKTPYQHILVWLFCNKETDKKFSKCYQDLIDLFCYRNKIIQSYRDSRQVYKALDITYNKIEQEIDAVENITTTDTLSEDDLNKLQQKLKILAKSASEYTRLLRDLEEQRHTIAINTRNYGEKLKQIKVKIEKENSFWFANDLDFLERFLSSNCRRFQSQIKANLGYFLPGEGLIDRAIASIRGIVEIEQTRIDRQRQKDEQKARDNIATADKALQNEIQAIGIAVGAGAIMASTSGLITQPWQTPSLSRPLHPFLIALFLSFIVAVASGWIVRLWQKTKDKQN